MRQLIYISTAAPDLAKDDIANILDVSVRNNPEREITGFLLFNGRNFLQLVEGPKAALGLLMHEIYRDARHTGVAVLEDEPIAARVCGAWTMKRLMLSDDVAARVTYLEEMLPESLIDRTRRTVLNFASLN